MAKQNRSLAMIRFLYDEYMFRLLPREFTAAVMAALVPLLLLSVYWWGVVVGLLADVAFIYGSSRLRQDSIVKALSRIQIGSAVGVVLTLVWSYFTFITEFTSPVYDILVMVVTPLIFLTLYLASYTPAESLPPRVERGRLYQKIVRAGYREGMTEAESDAVSEELDLYKSIWSLKKLTPPSEASEVHAASGSVALDLDEEFNDGDLDVDSQSLLRPAARLPPRLCACCLTDKSEGSTHCFVSNPFIFTYFYMNYVHSHEIIFLLLSEMRYLCG